MIKALARFNGITLTSDNLPQRCCIRGALFNSLGKTPKMLSIGIRVNTLYTDFVAKKLQDEPAMVKVRELFKESGLSLVELGRRMGYAEETARQSAWQFMQAHDPRMSMLRKFAVAIGVPLDHLTPRGKRMNTKLETELEEHEVALSPDEFRDLLVTRKHDTSPAWTIDELVCHPDEAKEFCNLIRAEIDCPDMADATILRTLMNVRRSN